MSVEPDVLVVVGPGGVGKTTISAALGLDALLRYLRVHTEKLIERGTAKRAPGSPDRAAGPSSRLAKSSGVSRINIITFMGLTP